MIRIGICDDDGNARDELRFCLEKKLYEGSEKIVYEFASGKTLESWLKSHPGEIDLVFLDVEMNGQNGIETARHIRDFDEDILIIFVTGYRDYVFEGYEVCAMDYVVKPVNELQIGHILDRVRKNLEKNREQFFVFRNTDGTYRIPYKKILYFYSEKRKVILVTEQKEYAFYGKLDHVQKLLEKEFVRIYQRYLVNPVWIGHIGKDEVCIGEHILPISRSLKGEAMSALAKTLLKGGR